MELFSINTGHFKLDGGAMFGVVPKSIWQRLNPADENNMCSWAMRCLLVKDGNRLILIDNGMGNKQNDKFFGYYFLHGNDTLDLSLAKYGFCKDDITDVLNFTVLNEEGQKVTLFLIFLFMILIEELKKNLMDFQRNLPLS